jgi:hypothetical protein
LYYRNPDYIIDVDRLTKAARTMPEPKPVSLANRRILSVGLIVAPVITFFLILGVARLVAAF